METSPSPEAVREAYAAVDADGPHKPLTVGMFRVLVQHSRALESRVKGLEDYAKMYCAPIFEEYILRLEAENAAMREALEKIAAIPQRCDRDCTLEAVQIAQEALPTEPGS